MLDTIEKRASSLGGIGSPFRFVLPWPSGSIDVEQRAHLCGTYALDFQTVAAHGPFMWAALSSYVPGLSLGGGNIPGLVKSDEYVPGLRAGQASTGE